MKILVVDDSMVMRRINSNVIKQLGFNDDVVTAENGEVGMEVFNKGGIDLILLDVNMPVMDGFEMLKRVRAKDKNVKIFMCTTEGGRTEVVKALRIGANNYIVKPLDKNVLSEKINDIRG